MGLSLEDRKRKLIEDVCASCSGGGGQPTGGAGSFADGLGQGGDFGDLVKALSLIKKSKKKRKEQDGS